MKEHLPLNIRLTSKLEETLSEQGFSLANEWLYDKFKVQLPDNFDRAWRVSQGDFQGKFPTRVKKWLTVQGLKAKPSEISELGDVVAPHVPRPIEYIYDFVNEFNWSPGDFGEEENSCYWGERSYARTMLKDHDSLAIRFYGIPVCDCDCHTFKLPCSRCAEEHTHCTCGCHDPNPATSRWYAPCHYCRDNHTHCICPCHQVDLPEENRACCGRWHQRNKNERGIGRAWLAFQGESLIVFNAYGPYSLETVAQLLSKRLNLPYQKVRFTNHGSADSTLWINSAKGIMLGKTLKDEIDLDWDEKEENEYTCDVCGRGLDEEDINSSPDGDGTYCNDCYRERWAYCESCGEDRSREDGSTISHQFYCESCRDEIFTRCDDCDHWTRRDEIVIVTALSPNGFTETREVGENCLAHYKECSHCHDFFSPGLLENGVCKECQPALPLMELAQMENV